MKNNPIAVIGSFIIVTFIAYMHNKHIFPFNSILNEIIMLFVCISLVLLLSKGD